MRVGLEIAVGFFSLAVTFLGDHANAPRVTALGLLFTAVGFGMLLARATG